MLEYFPRIQCGLRKITFQTREAIGLYLPDGDVCDMTDTIGYALSLNPKVTQINIYEGRRLAVRYHRQRGHTKWHAYIFDDEGHDHAAS